MSTARGFRRRAGAGHDQFQRRPTLCRPAAARAAARRLRELLRRRPAARAELRRAPGRCALPRGARRVPSQCRRRGHRRFAAADRRDFPGARLCLQPLHASPATRYSSKSRPIPIRSRSSATMGSRSSACRSTDGGMDLGQFERLLAQHRPKLVYTIPSFHNPTGQTLALAPRAPRRAQPRARLRHRRRRGVPAPASRHAAAAVVRHARRARQRALARLVLENPRARPAARLDPDECRN